MKVFHLSILLIFYFAVSNSEAILDVNTILNYIQKCQEKPQAPAEYLYKLLDGSLLKQQRPIWEKFMLCAFKRLKLSTSKRKSLLKKVLLVLRLFAEELGISREGVDQCTFRNNTEFGVLFCISRQVIKY